MEKELKNKIVVITGGAQGIGYEIADKFLQKGAKIVILLDINEKQGVEAVKTLTTKHGNNKAMFFKCDVTKDLDAAVSRIISTYKHVDVLVNNAGVLNEANPKNTIDINVQAVIDWSFKFLEHMRKDKNGKGGTVINMCSLYGIKISQFVPVYHASKFAVFGFTKSLGHEYNYARYGVRVVAICPGFTYTKIVENPKLRDEETLEDFVALVEKEEWQKVDAVGEAAVKIFETAESGTAWLIEGAKPVVEV